MATLQQLEAALKNADAAGDMDAARKLAVAVVNARKGMANQIPDTQVPGTIMQPPEPTLAEQVIGAGETGLALATGATGGMVGMIGGTLKGLAEQILAGKFGTPQAANLVEQSAAEGMQALTYAPRTPAGQAMTETTGKALAQVLPVTPLTAELGAITAGARAAAPAMQATAQRVAAPVKAAAQKIAGKQPKTEPVMTVYRGTAVEETVPGETAKFPAVFTTADKNYAGQYGKIITEYQLPKSKVLDYDLDIAGTGTPAEALAKEYLIQTGKTTEERFAIDPRMAMALLHMTPTPEWVSFVKSKGYDAINMHTKAQPQNEVMVLRPEVLKKPTTGTMGSGGAAAVDIATLRQAKADELPVPIRLTEGQKTRAFEQQRFERETAKLPEVGEPLRERFAQQNRQLQQNMDAFIDMTGAEAPDLRSVGLSVDKALRERAARDKTKIRTLYKDAEKAGELEQPVQLSSVVQHLVESAPEAEVANVLKATRAKALQLGVAVEDASGNLVPQPVTLKTAELFRRSINGATNAEPTNIRQAAIMKQLVDGDTESAGGALYKQARRARSEYANNYENIGLVKQLLGLKRGSSDRSIALEDVLRRSIIDPSTSLDTVRQVHRLLQTGGENGAQAWKELQGGTLRHIKDEALKNVAPDQMGNRVMSPAQLDRVIMQLDKNGKLDYVFGKKGAEQLRTINDVAKDVLTAPAGAVNTSNTATVLAGLMDVAISGTSGVPAPIMTSFRVMTNSIKDARLKAKVRKTLGE